MFQEKALMFIYCVTPVHAGTGTAIGAIDSPIQRERHTGYPTIAGSGIKGALREHCRGNGSDTDPALTAVFGPPPASSSDHAGACSFADAQIVLFPVRSPKNAFYYVTCPTALFTLQRLAALANVPPSPPWRNLQPEEPQYIPLGTDAGGQLYLEAFKFEKASGDGVAVGEWLANQALPAEKSWLAFFRNKIKQDVVLVHNEVFGHFVRHSTLVEPHVRINDESGTAEDGGLFYVENLPPESLLVSLVMASKVRRNANNTQTNHGNKIPESAADVIRYLEKKLDGQLVQLGGDSTTGRGQVLLHFVTREVNQ
jgi:CRISPR-associated protein Cmr4